MEVQECIDRVRRRLGTVSVRLCSTCTTLFNRLQLDEVTLCRVQVVVPSAQLLDDGGRSRGCGGSGIIADWLADLSRRRSSWNICRVL